MCATVLVIPTALQTPQRALADAIPPAGIVVRGHGNGHGRGMSQYGAYAWATGWPGQAPISWEAILDFYYGGGGRAVAQVAGGESVMSTRLTTHDGRQTAVVSDTPALSWSTFGGYSSMIARPVGRNVYDVYASNTVSCGATSGTPTGFTLIASRATGPIDFTTANSQNPAAANPTDLVGICETGSPTRIRYYRGVIRATNDANGAYRTVNRVATDSYLRGVVPRESPASWADSAGGAGINALRAQAVAARSYALSESRYSYAKTCDTQDCQVYGGAALRNLGSATVTVLEDARSDRAVSDTANFVIQNSNGTTTRTEYTSSNGGRTAGGTFPAKADPGDIAADVDRQSWTRIISASAIQARYTSIGVLLNVTTKHDGAGGDFGGYTDEVIITGTAGTTTVSGWSFKSTFDLPAPWYGVSPIASGNPNDAPVGSILYVGDSVGEGITSYFQTTVLPAYPNVNYQACVGRGMAGASCQNPVQAAQLNLDGVGVINASETPAVAIVQLGYNDDPATFTSEAQEMISALMSKSVQRIIFVNMSTRSTTRNYSQSNQVLTALAARNANVTVFDWNSYSGTPERWRWFNRDGVHLNLSGQPEFAIFLRDQLDALRAQNLLPVTASTSHVVFGLPLVKNNRGKMVTIVQRRLNKVLKLKGSKRLSTKGIYGTSTVRQVKRMQRRVGLPVTGKVDRATWDALGLSRRKSAVILSVGTRNTAVKSAQRSLAKVLKKKIRVTGVYDRTLANYVKTYQRRAKIKATGTINLDTWTSIMSSVTRLSRK